MSKLADIVSYKPFIIIERGKKGEKTYRKSNGNTEQSDSVYSSKKVYLASICESPILPCSKGRNWFESYIMFTFSNIN